MEHFEGIESYSVKHLPIVKAYTDRLGLVELVNYLVPSEMDLSPGIFFLGMVLDTLSGRNPLYRLEHFFEEQDTELLLGKEIDAKSFNDVNVGRFLDKAFEVGAVKIFKEISVQAVERFGLDCRHVHFDTTSRSVYGDYEAYGNDPLLFQLFAKKRVVSSCLRTFPRKLKGKRYLSHGLLLSQTVSSFRNISIFIFPSFPV